MAHKVLLIDGGAANRIVLRVKIASAHHQVLLADSMDEAKQIIRRAKPALILADAASIGMTAELLCEVVRSWPETRESGLILLENGDCAETRAALLSAGADDVLAKPVDDLTLMPVMRSLLRRYEEARHLSGTVARSGLVPEAPGSFSGAALAFSPDEKGLVTIVSTELVRARQLKAMLAGYLRDTVNILDLTEALRREAGAIPDVLVVDVGPLDVGTAAAAISDLRTRFAGNNTVIVAVTAHDDAPMQALARDLGAVDALAFGAGATELAARLRSQLARKRTADVQRFQIDEGLRLAAIDPLTGLLNRRAGLIAIERLIHTCRERAQPLSLLLLDLDDFKSINDTYGHSAGDAALKRLAALLPTALRDGDILCRLGGDEFLVALPDAPAAVARLVARRIERNIAGHLPSVAIGPATVEPGKAASIDEIVAQADHAMYLAKSRRGTAFHGRSVA